MNKLQKELEIKINYKFKNPDMLNQALIHKVLII